MAFKSETSKRRQRIRSRRNTRHAIRFATNEIRARLNQVESWFSKLQRDVIDRGIFTSVADLKRKILRYIRLCQKRAKPQCKYSDVRKRIPAW